VVGSPGAGGELRGRRGLPAVDGREDKRWTRHRVKKCDMLLEVAAGTAGDRGGGSRASCRWAAGGTSPARSCTCDPEQLRSFRPWTSLGNTLGC
jgi:hypothetical protein